MSSEKYTKKPMLSTTSIVVQLRRGETKIYWKSSMDAEEFEKGDFLKKKISVKLLSGQACETHGMRGFACNKKTI